MVNIIIPVFHSRETLPRALDSLVAQTKKMFIITVVQDCDREDYTDIIQEYQRRNLHINIISLPKNVGPGLARQIGMNHDNFSSYFMFLDSDDMYTPRAVEVLSRAIQKNDLDIVTSSFIRNEKNNDGVLQHVKDTPITWCAGKIYSARYLKENNIQFHPELRLNEDSYFNLVAWNSTPKHGRIEETTYVMMDNENSLTRSDGMTGFFIKGWEQYVISQIEGLSKIYELTNHLNPEMVARTMINLYDEFMTAQFLKLDMSKSRKYLKKLDVEWYHEILASLEFWAIIQDQLKACRYFDEKLFFYKVRFCDWLKWVEE